MTGSFFPGMPGQPIPGMPINPLDALFGGLNIPNA